MQFFVEQQRLADQETELIIVGFFENDEDSKERFATINTWFDGGLTEWFAAEQALSWKKTSLIQTMGKIKAKYILAVGLGKKETYSADKVRELFCSLTQEVLKLKVKGVVYDFESFLKEGISEEEIAYLLAESTFLASYRFETYKTDKKEQTSLEQVTLVVNTLVESIYEGLKKGKAYGQGTCLARDLVNTPGNLLTPTILSQKALEIAERYQMECTILERQEMEELGMGALLAVAQGSDQPPKMIIIKYQGLPEWDNVLAFVGKGLTFDSGGISIKPSANMDEMKMDMGGGASVLGALEIIGRLQPACNILAVIPSTENMPNGRALKPGDVITSLSGKTIEVKNTDAEGRLILADGITYAKQLGANYIVDIATLTGAILIALGDCTTGAVTNNEEFMIDVLEAAQEVDEPMWRLPNYEPYREMVKSSDVADLNNAPGRLAGSITAGLFLGEFAEETPWVHLDIAGTAWSNKKSDSTQKGGTGVMVRTLAALAQQMASQKQE